MILCNRIEACLCAVIGSSSGRMLVGRSASMVNYLESRLGSKSRGGHPPCHKLISSLELTSIARTIGPKECGSRILPTLQRIDLTPWIPDSHVQMLSHAYIKIRLAGFATVSSAEKQPSPSALSKAKDARVSRKTANDLRIKLKVQYPIVAEQGC